MLCAIPIEIASRELDGVIYLALHLAKRGLPTLFGERMVTQYVKHNDRPVLYFDIEQYAPMNRKVLDSGGLVFNLNVEGFAFLCDTKFISIFEHIQNDVTKICLFGQKQYDIVCENLPDLPTDLFVPTGHQSFDLAKERFTPYYRNEKIVSAHGDNYILVNANNGIFNHAMGFEYYLKMLQGMDEWEIYRDEEYQKWLRKQMEYQREMAEAKIVMVKHLAKRFPDRHIIVRPHPTENKAYYSDALVGYSNVYVDNSGQVREWIATAAFIIHHDCTTSLEALLMGKPVIQYRPIYNEEYNDALLAQNGVQAQSVEEVESIILTGDMPEELRKEQLARLEPYLMNISASASEKVADMAAEMANLIPETWIPESPSLWGSIKCWRKHLSKVLRSKQPGRNGRKVSYALNKFPRLPLSEVQKRVDKLREIEPSLPDVDVTHLTLNTFLMQPQSDRSA